MKTQLSKPVAPKRATRINTNRRRWNYGVPVVAAPRRWRLVGIRAPLLYRWAHLEREPNASKAEPKSKRSVEALEAEIRRLRAENAKLLEQREVLKKSLGILSEVPPRGMPESSR